MLNVIKWLLFIVPICLVTSTQALSNTNITIKAGNAFIIAHPDNALSVETTAANELAVYLQKSIGVEAQIMPEGELESPNAADVYIGHCKFTKLQDFYLSTLKQEAFQITVNKSRLFIYGDDEKGDPFSGRKRTGTLLGVYDFLENEVGVAWIWPGESGEDVPTLKELTLQSFSRLDYPRFCIRSMLFGYMKWEPENVRKDIKIWCKRMKLSWIQKAWFGHSWGRYIFKTGMDKEHPEWLALWNGERKKPHCCTSNKEFRDYIVEQCLTNPVNKGKSIVSISPSDGYGFCECAECRALDPEGTDYIKCGGAGPNLSNRHWAYVNYVAKEVKKRNPDLNIGMFAYTAYRKPPTNIDKLEDNIYLSFTFSAAYFVQPESKAKYYSQVDAWKSKGVKIVGREYWGMHYWLDLPFIFTRQIKESTPYLYKRGLIAMYGEAQKNFATQGPNYYLVAHLMWDPEANADKIMNRYYKAFGPSAKDIESYYNTFEQSVLDNQEHIKGFGYHPLVNSWPELFPEKTILQAKQHLINAQKSVAGNKKFEARVEFVGIGFKYTEIMVELLGIYRALGRSGVPLWFFGYEGDVVAVKHHNLPDMPDDWKKFWKEYPTEPISQSEKTKLLKRALFLGNEREKIIEEYAELPAISRGMYQYTIHTKIRPWHQTIKDELKKQNIITDK